VSHSHHKNRLRCSGPNPARDRKALETRRHGPVVECQALRCREPAVGQQPIFSPWLFGLSAGAQTTIGLFIAVLAVAALAAFAVWEEWLSLIAGLWLIGSPWVLGFEDTGQGANRSLNPLLKRQRPSKMQESITTRRRIATFQNCLGRN
jgi:SPW repeat